MSKAAEDYGLEAQMRRGFEIIEKAVDERIKASISESNTWKDLATSRGAQLQTLTSDLGKAQESISMMEKRLQLLESENKTLRASKTMIQSKYNALKRASIQLEKFRSSIIQMVEHAPQNVVDDPCMSLLVENMPFRDKRSLSYQHNEIDASTASLRERTSVVGNGSSSNIKSSRKSISERSTLRRHSSQSSASTRSQDGVEHGTQATLEGYSGGSATSGILNDKTSASRTSSSTAADAQALYGKIRESISPGDFANFATVINLFNNQKMGIAETLREVEKLIPDKDLYQKMKQLVYRAMEESMTDAKSPR